MTLASRVAYDTGSRALGISQQIWMIEGKIELLVGTDLHHMAAGDCLAMRVDQLTVFRNPAGQSARYVVALTADRPRQDSARRTVEGYYERAGHHPPSVAS